MIRSCKLITTYNNSERLYNFVVMGGSSPAAQLSVDLSSCNARNCTSEHLITRHGGFGSLIPVAPGIQHNQSDVQGVHHLSRFVAPAIPDKQHSSTQMTIFYGGTVNVYDDIPPNKAQAILMLAGGKIHISCRSHPPPTESVPLMNYSQSIPKVSDFPLERKNSIQRFLQKRKERQRAKAPHATQANRRTSQIEFIKH